VHGRRRRVFCASLADVFDNQVDPAWRADLWSGVIHATPDIDWLLLTKRPQNIADMLPVFWDEIKGHVWLGTTVEDQEHADRTIPHLLKHDAAVRFVSVEPMLGPIDLGLGRWVGLFSGRFNDPVTREIDWVIAGGESGPHARPSHPIWFERLRDQCAAAGVPFLFKQWGEFAPGGAAIGDPRWVRLEDEATGRSAGLYRYGKKAAGRLLAGVEHNGFPSGGGPP